MTLHFYFARKFLRSFFSVLLIFFAVLTMTALIEQIRKFGGTDETGFGALLGLAILSVPESLYRILPLIMILATLALFLGSGAIFGAGGHTRLGTVGVEKSGGPGRACRADRESSAWRGSIRLLRPRKSNTTRRFRACRARRPPCRSVPRGLWLRQGTPDGQTVIRAARSNLDGTELFGVTFPGI